LKFTGHSSGIDMQMESFPGIKAARRVAGNDAACGPMYTALQNRSQRSAAPAVEPALLDAKEVVMTRYLVLILAAALLGGCIVLPLGHGHRGGWHGGGGHGHHFGDSHDYGDRWGGGSRHRGRR
jgi:hypothetical protein